MKKYKIGLLLLAVCLVITGLILQNCKPHDGDDNTTPPTNTHPYVFPNIPWFPTKMNIPADNPTTVEGVKLGRYLFYDGRWPGRFDPDSQMTCATCHVQENSFVCGINHPKFHGHPYGVTGILTPHFMMPMINLVYCFNGYLWNGKVNDMNTTLGGAYGVPAKPPFHWRNIETLAWLGLYAPHEMKSDTVRAFAALRSIANPNYKSMFKDAFGTEDITMERVMKAIAQFVRTLISYQSKYDSVVHMHLGRFTTSEARGYQIYMTEQGDCFHCHGEPSLLTNNLFMNNGLDSVFTDIRDRYSWTKDTNDKGAYKVSTLRNIALRAPYMRDGRFTTLEQVVDFYATGVKNTNHIHPLMKWAFQGGNHLDDYQKKDLIAFLKTLTDYTFIHNPEFSKPADLP